MCKKWISVKDRLPEGNWAPPLGDFSNMVLVANTASVEIAFYNRIDRHWYTDCPADCIEWIDKTTHWQELPESPHV